MEMNSSLHDPHTHDIDRSSSSNDWDIVVKRGTVLNGTSGILANFKRKEFEISHLTSLLSENLPFNILTKSCFMWNFADEGNKNSKHICI